MRACRSVFWVGYTRHASINDRTDLDVSLTPAQVTGRRRGSFPNRTRVGLVASSMLLLPAKGGNVEQGWRLAVRHCTQRSKDRFG
jgi:hypothetical protein